MSLKAIHILVVDDDEGLRSLLREYLSRHDYCVSVAESAATARSLLSLFRFDLLILDVMMPQESGVEFTRILRADGEEEKKDNILRDIPILMLTARGEGEDRIKGLQAGADDYLSKPFEPQELLLRIRAILRRARSVSSADLLARGPVRFGAWSFDLPTRRLRGQDGDSLYLTESEADLLSVLADSANQAVSREDIMRLCDYASHAVSERSIDVQITRLRRKLETDPKRPQYLMTVRNRGYLLRCER